MSWLEAVFARGSRRLAPVLEKASELGCCFDAWDEYLKIEQWREAFAACGVDPDFYATRNIPEDEVLPWDHIFSGVDKRYMLAEYKRALAGCTTPDCASGCRG